MNHKYDVLSPTKSNLPQGIYQLSCCKNDSDNEIWRDVKTHDEINNFKNVVEWIPISTSGRIGQIKFSEYYLVYYPALERKMIKERKDCDG